MNRLLFYPLLLLLLASPAHTQEVLPQEPTICQADEHTYSIRTPDMDYYDFLRAADAMVLAAAPDWYVVGTPELPIIVQASPNLLGRFGEAWVDEQGVYHVVIGRLGLMLATVEDLASVMLHEYVHVLEWENVRSQPWSENCHSARQELMANRVVIEHYLKLGYSSHMLENSRRLYAQAKALALINQCPAEVMSNMPEVPMPVSSTSTKELKFQIN